MEVINGPDVVWAYQGDGRSIIHSKESYYDAIELNIPRERWIVFNHDFSLYKIDPDILQLLKLEYPEEFI